MLYMYAITQAHIRDLQDLSDRAHNRELGSVWGNRKARKTQDK